MILLSLGLLSELNKKQVSILAGLLQCLNIPPEGTKSLHGCSLLPALGAVSENEFTFIMMRSMVTGRQAWHQNSS